MPKDEELKEGFWVTDKNGHTRELKTAEDFAAHGMELVDTPFGQAIFWGESDEPFPAHNKTPHVAMGRPDEVP